MAQGLVVGTADSAATAAFGIISMISFNSRFDPPFRLAVPGGRTPALLLEKMAHAASNWPGLQILFVDERAVPPDDPASNFAMVQRTLIEPMGEYAPAVFRMRGEAADLEDAREEYERELEKPLSMVLLGVGEDGHIASLFPGSPILEETERRVAIVEDSPKPPRRRLTITPRVLREAGSVIVLATGEDKRAAVTRALVEPGEPRDCPARLVRDALWIVDAEAGADVPPSLLPRTSRAATRP